MPRIRIEVYAFSLDALKENIAEIARDTGFVPEPNGVEPIMESNWWVYGTGPANLTHDFVRAVELAGRPEPLVSLPPPKPAAKPGAVWLRVKVFGHSLEMLDKYAALFAETTGFVPDEGEPTADEKGTWWYTGYGSPDMKHDFLREVVPMQRLRVRVYGALLEVVHQYVALVAVNTGFVPDNDDYTKADKGTWWVTGTGPANLKHDFVRAVELLPADKPVPQPAQPTVQSLAPPATRRLRLHIRASSSRQALLSAQEVAAETPFVLNEKLEPQRYTQGVWLIHGTGPADLKNELVTKVESLEGRLKVVIEASSPKQVLLTARAVAAETTFILDEGTAPTVETVDQQPIYAVYGNGPADLRHDLVESVSIVG